MLLLVELLFTPAISNAKVERLFSLMNRIKSDSRASLSQPILSALGRICMVIPECDLFDLIPAITLWNDSVLARRLNQKLKLQKKRKHKVRPKILAYESTNLDKETD